MIKKFELENGLKIVMEYIPYVRSVSLGIWFYCGSRKEDIQNLGISHFIEHMMFKGTDRRSAKDIAESIDFVGGQINAFTSKESTCYYTKSLDTHLDLCIDVLSDMIFNSKFEEKDIDVEKKVVLEEINMYDDTPEELAYDLLYKAVWDGNPLGYPILGNKDTLKGITRDDIIKYVKENYTPYNTVVAIAGNFNEEETLKMIREKFDQWEHVHGNRIPYKKAAFMNNSCLKKKEIEQINMCLGFKGVKSGQDSVYDLTIINNIFGGGMSSRLFQKIREEKGLAYSIYSSPTFYQDTGLFTIFSGMNPNHLQQVVKLIKNEINIIKNDKISEDELNKAKEQLKGSYILGLESTGSRMLGIGKSELMHGRIRTQDEILKKINEVTVDSIADVIDNIFDFDKLGISIVGNIDEDYDIRRMI
jgi:predicted Zn-dependent peptidase